MDHETWNQAVEGRFVVGARRAKSEKVLGRLGNGFAEHFEFDVTVGRVKLQYQKLVTVQY